MVTCAEVCPDTSDIGSSYQHNFLLGAPVLDQRNSQRLSAPISSSCTPTDLPALMAHNYAIGRPAIRSEMLDYIISYSSARGVTDYYILRRTGASADYHVCVLLSC